VAERGPARAEDGGGAARRSAEHVTDAFGIGMLQRAVHLFGEDALERADASRRHEANAVAGIQPPR
jgi:hypothetical protein